MTETMELAWELIRRHPRAAARTLEELPAADVVAFLREIPPELGSEALSRMTMPAAARVVEPLEPPVAAALLRGTSSSVGAGVLRYLRDPLRSQILELLPAKTARACRQLLLHREDTLGAWMEPRVLVVPDDVTVDAAVRRLRQSTERKTAWLYVVDRDRRLRGAVEIWNLLSADRNARISTLTRRPRRTLAARTPLTTILDHGGWNDADELPIVGTDGDFLGVLRHAEFIRIVQTRFPSSSATGVGTAAMEATTDFWEGMSGFLETIAAIPTPPVDEKKGE